MGAFKRSLKDSYGITGEKIEVSTVEGTPGMVFIEVFDDGVSKSLIGLSGKRLRKFHRALADAEARA